MICKKYLICISFLSLFSVGWLPGSLYAQQDSIPIQVPAADVDEQLIEDFIQNSEEEGDFDFNTAFETFRDRPMNLNKVSREELEVFGLLNPIQISDLLRHRETFGNLLSVHELQAIPSFDLATIRQILPYVSTYTGLDDYHVPIHKMLVEGKNELYLRWQRVLETQKGYTPLEEGQTGSRYTGDQNKLYMRYRHSYQNRLSYGFTAEKDAGEEFFTGSNKQGFDFYSAHLYLNNYNKFLKTVALGDYRLSMGQGLIRFSGFGAGKSSFVTSIHRGGNPIYRYSSVNEAAFLRGAAATIGLSEKLQLTAFSSFRKRDANIITNDSLEIDESTEFSSLQISGLHRTENEIADENALQQKTFGGILKYKLKKGHIAINALYDQFDKKLTRTPQPYNQFYFGSDRLFNASLDYSRQFQNYYFFGETAMSDNNRFATLNGLLVGLDQHTELAVLHRYFQKDYHAIDANPFSEKTGARNEQGLYIGVIFRPATEWSINTYIDAYQHPWLLFDADGPSKGIDYLAKITYRQKRKMEAYIQLRTETKQVNSPESQNKIDPLVNSQQLRLRLHIANRVTPSIELRSRVYWGFAQRGDETRQKGFAAYQDIIYKSRNIPLQVSARFAVYDTDSYAIRFYAYENDLLYAFSVPAYYNKGTRYYLNVRYRGIRNITLELRYARTYWSDQQSIGGGLEEIDGNTKSEVKAQVRFRF